MVTKIQRWGNSQGLRIPLQILDSASMTVGDEVDISAKEGVIVIRPVRRVRGKRNLKELVKSIPKDFHPEEVPWGGPVGREVW